MHVSFPHIDGQNKSFVIKPTCAPNEPNTHRRSLSPRAADPRWTHDVTTIAALSTATGRADRPNRSPLRVLWVACGTHALHDGLTDTLYLLLPLWQAEFALGYGAIGLLRALYAGSMAGLQVPAARIARRVGGARMLAAGTAIAGAAYLGLGASSSCAVLAAALVLGGIGSSTQHPIASGLVATAYEGPRSRGALGTYNFAGDLGKMALPSIAACLIAVMSWRSTASVIGMIGLIGAGAILLSLRRAPAAVTGHTEIAAPVSAPVIKTADGPVGSSRRGFALLLAIGIIDSATRMGFLTFLPFVLRGKGAGLPEIGIALTLVFAGGAAGKLVCGFLGARLGVLPTILITEGATAAGIVALLPLPLGAALALLPAIGVALNGTSSVLYGTVPDLVAAERRESAFGVFYTGTVGAGALSPALYGLFSDAIGLSAAMLLVAAVVLLILPLAWQLRHALATLASGHGSPAVRAG
jgi:MFS transporter, FSR family, fosmidomycin resistance protein